MAKRGAPKGWAQTLREQMQRHKEDAEFWEELFTSSAETNTTLHNRLWEFNKLPTWRKLLFVIKGGWV